MTQKSKSLRLVIIGAVKGRTSLELALVNAATEARRSLDTVWDWGGAVDDAKRTCMVTFFNDDTAADLRGSIHAVDAATKANCRYTLYVNRRNYHTVAEQNAYVIRRVAHWLRKKKFPYTITNDYSQSFFNMRQRVWVPSIGFVGWKQCCRQYETRQCGVGLNHRKGGMGHRYDEPTSACGSTGNGSLKYILVGESPSECGGGVMGLPFYNDASGCVLHDALDSLGVHPTQYYLTNTVKCWPTDNKLAMHGSGTYYYELECVQRLRMEIESLQRDNPNARVISVGKIAAAALAKLEIEHTCVYHPAYYLRLGQQEEFRKDLQAAMYYGGEQWESTIPITTNS